MTPLQQFVQKWSKCTNCDLHKDRTKVVLFKGTVPCDVLFVGEAPGTSEDLIGVPFVGAAGHLLDEIVNQAWSSACAETATLSKAFANLVCCIPKEEDGSKAVEPDEAAIESCKERLVEFIKLCDPKTIVAVGRLARDWFEPGYKHSIIAHKPISTDLKSSNKNSIRCVDIMHPAAVLRQNIAQRSLSIRKASIRISDAINTIGNK